MSFDKASPNHLTGPVALGSKRVCLQELEIYVINLEESRQRWTRLFRNLCRVFSPAKIHRVPAVNGLDFSKPGTPSEWEPESLQRLQRESCVADAPIPDPVRTAVCLSHQRALHQFLLNLPLTLTGDEWVLILEDDAQLGETLLGFASGHWELEVPSEAELLFLHDRVLTSCETQTTSPQSSIAWRSVIGGIGLEAYLVSATGAQKMIDAWSPLHYECDVQLMAFMMHYADAPTRQQIWRQAFHPHERLIHAYAPSRPLFQVGDSIPSVKLNMLTAKNPRLEPKLPPSTKLSGLETPALGFDMRNSLAFATCWFNPLHYRTRLENFLRFYDGMQDCNLVIVELAFHDDEWQLPDDIPNLIRLRSNTVCWQKEALLNHAFSVLSQLNFDYLGWIDADVLFEDVDWQDRVLETLQTKRLCQIFEDVDTSFPDRGRQRLPGAAVSWMKHGIHPVDCRQPGFGWAMQRGVWQQSSLYDVNIVGGADGIMWRSLFHSFLEEKLLYESLPQSPGIRRFHRNWAHAWSSSVGLQIGYAKSVRITSLPHGSEKDRRYHSRNKRLIQHVYDPEQHILRDASGLLKWSAATASALKEVVAEYFSIRQEDSQL